MQCAVTGNSSEPIATSLEHRTTKSSACKSCFREICGKNMSKWNMFPNVNVMTRVPVLVCDARCSTHQEPLRQNSARKQSSGKPTALELSISSKRLLHYKLWCLTCRFLKLLRYIKSTSTDLSYNIYIYILYILYIYANKLEIEVGKPPHPAAHNALRATRSDWSNQRALVAPKGLQKWRSDTSFATFCWKIHQSVRTVSEEIWTSPVAVAVGITLYIATFQPEEISWFLLQTCTIN